MTNIRHGFIPDNTPTEVGMDDAIKEIIDEIEAQLTVSDNALIDREMCYTIIHKLGGTKVQDR